MGEVHPGTLPGHKPMRFAFITVGDTRRLTGGYLYHARVFAELRARGVDLVEIVASDAPLAAQLRRAPSFGVAFDPGSYDVVVVDALASAICAPWIDGWRAERPVVAMVHELPSVAGGNGDLRELEAPLLRADMLIAVSGHGRAILQRRGVPPERIRVVSPGRDRLGEAPRPATTDHRSAAAGVTPRRSPLVALCVAQWIPRKGILALVRAWGMRDRPGARLELIGETTADPRYEHAVRAAIAEGTRAAPIRVRGPVDDEALGAAYRSAALFVLPSVYEGYGMVYAEALSHGLPVIACDAGPVPELVGAAGLIVPPDSRAALDGALSSLLGDEALRARLAREARARAAALPTWEETALGFQRALEDVVTGRR